MVRAESNTLMTLRRTWSVPLRSQAQRRAALPTAAGRAMVRGYTLVELMAVVAIVGVLAALAIYGVRRYLASSKTAEAKNQVGAIARSAVAAYERDAVEADVLSQAGTQATEAHDLCLSSTWVPLNITSVKGRKYQPATQDGSDFQTGDMRTGWKCLRYENTQPINFQLNYCRECGDWSGQLGGTYFVARAQGDADADGIYARFMRGGYIDDGAITTQTQVWMDQELE